MVGTSVGRYDNRQLCCAVKDTQLPEKYKQNSDVPNRWDVIDIAEKVRD
jgi:hypothetical protein